MALLAAISLGCLLPIVSSQASSVTQPTVQGSGLTGTPGCVVFTASGTNRITVDCSKLFWDAGNNCLAIGTNTCVGNVMVIQSPSGSAASVSVVAPGAQQAAFSALTNGVGRLIFGAQGNGDLFFFDANQARDFIDISHLNGNLNLQASGGDVHVGGTTASGYKLDVQACGTTGCVQIPSLVGKSVLPGISGCSASLGGGSTDLAGAIISGTTGACTVALTFSSNAPNGWVCSASNQSTANLIRQSAFSAGGVTFNGITNNGDFITYQCAGF